MNCMRLILILSIFFAGLNLSGQTKVVLLGTGNPNPDPEHSGCCVAIIVNNCSYVVDFGPGLVRQAARLSPGYGGKLKALSAENLNCAFLTHLHSDHTVGLPDLMLTPWVIGRNEPLKINGPKGTKKMVHHITKAYRADIRYRNNGTEPANNIGWRTKTKEFTDEGLIYQDSLVKVETFKVEHGTMPNAFGFRFTTPDKTIVISGDTRPCENLIIYARNADILIHEVYSYAGWLKRSEVWKSYHTAHHTSTYELGEIAAKTNPGKLVLYHLLLWGANEDDLLKEISKSYKNDVFVGRDLMVIE